MGITPLLRQRVGFGVPIFISGSLCGPVEGEMFVGASGAGSRGWKPLAIVGSPVGAREDGRSGRGSRGWKPLAIVGSPVGARGCFGMTPAGSLVNSHGL